MNINPQPGDTWTQTGYDTIEVVAVKNGSVYHTYGKKPMCNPLDKFRDLAQRSIARGAVMRRGGEVFSKELEGFEI